jgi:hypothetical protein
MPAITSGSRDFRVTATEASEPREGCVEVTIEKPVHREALVISAAGFGAKLVGAFGALVLNAEQLDLRRRACTVMLLRGSGHRVEPGEIPGADFNHAIGKRGFEQGPGKIAPEDFKLVGQPGGLASGSGFRHAPHRLGLAEERELLFESVNQVAFLAQCRPALAGGDAAKLEHGIVPESHRIGVQAGGADTVFEGAQRGMIGAQLFDERVDKRRGELDGVGVRRATDGHGQAKQRQDQDILHTNRQKRSSLRAQQRRGKSAALLRWAHCGR